MRWPCLHQPQQQVRQTYFLLYRPRSWVSSFFIWSIPFANLNCWASSMRKLHCGLLRRRIRHQPTVPLLHCTLCYQAFDQRICWQLCELRIRCKKDAFTTFSACRPSALSASSFRHQAPRTSFLFDVNSTCRMKGEPANPLFES